jgi:hypothetical protein
MAKAKQAIDHIRVYPSDNGGHVVEHHFEGPEYKAPEVHVFSKEQGQDVMGHIQKHAGVKC